jgi:glyoxylase-like metal-dependent hydrolase (beta-lactamase superfamily II)
MRLGQFELISLSDGVLRLDGGAMFGVVPKPLWTKRIPADDRNRIPLAMRPLLVRTGDANILIDAGIGDKMGPKDQDIYGLDRSHNLDASLAAAGLTAADIDIVIATHLHFDHVGGCTVRTEAGLQPHFPRARHIIRKGEWEDATHPHERNRGSYIADNFVPLLSAGVVEFHDDDTEVVPGIRVRRTGGHTRYHEMVSITNGGRTAVFVADLIPTTAHLDEPWIMGYDLYPVETLESKRAFLREAIEREYVIFFEHDMTVPAGVIRQDGGRKTVEPVTDIT